MTNGEFALALRQLATEAKSLATKLEGIDPTAIVLDQATLAKGPGVEPDPRVFVYCGAPASAGGDLEVEHFAKALNGVAEWLDNLKAPIEELEPSDPLAGSSK